MELNEIEDAAPEMKEQLSRVCNMEDVREIFKMLGYDDSGGVDIDEFCMGIMRAQADKLAELTRLVKQCSDILKRLKNMTSILESRSFGQLVEVSDFDFSGCAPACDTTSVFSLSQS